MWDDSDMGDNVGGRCLNSWQASRRMKAGRGAYEEIVVQLSFDERISGALGSVQGRKLPSLISSMLSPPCYETARMRVNVDKVLCRAEFLNPSQPAALRCIRRRDVKEQRFELMAFFDEMCAEDMDLPSHRTPEFLEASTLYHERLAQKLEAEQRQPVAPRGPHLPEPGARVSFREVAK